MAVAATLAAGIPAATAAAGPTIAAPPRIPATLQSDRLVQPLPIVSSCPAGGAACQQSIISPGYPAMSLPAGGAVQLQLGATARSVSLELGGATMPLAAGQAVVWQVPPQGGDAILSAVYPQGTIAYLLRFATRSGASAPAGPAPAPPAAPGSGTVAPIAGSGPAPPPVATVCAPAALHLEASRGGVDAPAVGPACRALGAPLARPAYADLARAAVGTKLTLRSGAPLRLRFDAPPRGTVRVEFRRGPDLKVALADQLPAVGTTWKARGAGSGVLVVVARFHAPLATGVTALVEARYAVRVAIR